MCRMGTFHYLLMYVFINDGYYNSPVVSIYKQMLTMPVHNYTVYTTYITVSIIIRNTCKAVLEIRQGLFPTPAG